MEETEAAELAAASAGLRDVTGEFVAVFERVDELGPELAEPLVETRDDPAFTQALEASLVDAGYRLATSASTATVPVAYVIREAEGGVTVTVGMGGVQARRSYSGSLQAAMPAGPLYVRGTDAAELRGPQAGRDDRDTGGGLVIALERVGDAPALDGRVTRPTDGIDRRVGWRWRRRAGRWARRTASRDGPVSLRAHARVIAAVDAW